MNRRIRFILICMWEAVVKIDVESSFPWEGKVEYIIHPRQQDTIFTFAVRIPSYVKEKIIRLNGNDISNCIEKKVEEKDGYLYFSGEWRDGEHLSIEFPMPVRKIYCNTAVRENENCVALMRGPVVYCFEGKDNPWPLQELRIPEKTVFAVKTCKEGLLKGMVLLEGEGTLMKSDGSLYSEEKPVGMSIMLKAIPYFAWGNRGVNQMRVWMAEE